MHSFQILKNIYETHQSNCHSQSLVNFMNFSLEKKWLKFYSYLEIKDFRAQTWSNQCSVPMQPDVLRWSMCNWFRELMIDNRTQPTHQNSNQNSLNLWLDSLPNYLATAFDPVWPSDSSHLKQSSPSKFTQALSPGRS